MQKKYWVKIQLDICGTNFRTSTGYRTKLITNIENKGNVFIVGDFKQSIYRFDGSQYEIFKVKELKQQFRTGNLDINFRSDKRILTLSTPCFFHK
jgi:ATP-dependent exoDNAse (exonuclease V) beta subunit